MDDYSKVLRLMFEAIAVVRIMGSDTSNMGLVLFMWWGACHAVGKNTRYISWGVTGHIMRASVIYHLLQKNI